MIVDRGFANYENFHRHADPAHRRYWLTRAKQGQRMTPPRVVQELGPGDSVVQLRPSAFTRQLHPGLPETLTVRAIQYQRKGFQPQTLLTSLLDPVAFPAAEIIALYHQRWELELAYDELKTHTLEREEASLRCRNPERVAQELWGLAVAYNLVRLTMAEVARRAGVLPTESATATPCTSCAPSGSALGSPARGYYPSACTLSTTNYRSCYYRRDETAPILRAVKIKMSNYPRKRPRPQNNGLN